MCNVLAGFRDVLDMTDDARPAAASASSAPGPAPSSVKRLPELTRAAMWTTAIVITVLTAGVVTVLWWPATAGAGLVGADLVKTRLDALKIGLSVGVGSGGVVALYLAWRRQHSTEADLDNRERVLAQQYEVLAHQQAVAAATQAYQERVANEAHVDAAARRITELYTKAVEQLGSDKAPVRLGGLYALERLAQDNETQRQTIVNVLCAYLRMPYDPPAEPDHDDDAGTERSDNYRERVQEREVRLTAQRLLHDHLDPIRDTAYWGALDLDLTGAQLIDFALTGARVGTSTFRKAIFSGTARFGRTTFTRDARFDEAAFTGDARFDEATFTGAAWFGGTTFTGDAQFGRVTFTDDALFGQATFIGDVLFSQASFSYAAWFGEATFIGDAWFSKVTFIGDARFGEATFTGDAWFGEATFTGDARFGRVTFNGDTRFGEVTFTGDAWFDKATFSGIPEFGEATFNGECSFDDSTADDMAFRPAGLSRTVDDPTSQG
ncbi:pentapeptide repeat-containing protein [Amycolatopsis thailandensis]|uniref:pentapeptide repeat-containing protein n=1 Tax=Amycolatopsis thailandensis TaxID=589330 RepID=UPI00365BA3D9